MDAKVNKYDPRRLPAYSLSEASHYLRCSKSTLSYWVAGKKNGGHKPVIDIADKKGLRLSFYNMVELFVISVIRKRYAVPLSKIRHAVSYLKKNFPSKHPLLDQRLETDKSNLFIDYLGELINISEHGQLAMREVLKGALHRIERDDSGMPIKLYPFIRTSDVNQPTMVEIDPNISFGRPVVAGTGITTSIIAERFNAGDSIEDIAEDYGRHRDEVEEAVRCELEAA